MDNLFPHYCRRCDLETFHIKRAGSHLPPPRGLLGVIDRLIMGLIDRLQL